METDTLLPNGLIMTFVNNHEQRIPEPFFFMAYLNAYIFNPRFIETDLFTRPPGACFNYHAATSHSGIINNALDKDLFWKKVSELLTHEYRRSKILRKVLDLKITSPIDFLAFIRNYLTYDAPRDLKFFEEKDMVGKKRALEVFIQKISPVTLDEPDYTKLCAVLGYNPVFMISQTPPERIKISADDVFNF